MIKRLSLCFLAAACWLAAANLSSVARTNNVVTVTSATAHNLLANQGFCIAGSGDASFNICGTVASVTSGTVFTFNQQATNLSVGAGGTVTAAKQIIVLDLDPNSTPGYVNVHFLCWLTTVNPLPIGTGSTWTPTNTNGSTAGSAGPSTAEVNAIKAGTTVERSHTISFANTASTGNMQTALQQFCAKDQANLQTSIQPAAYYGAFYDGAAWGAQ